MPNFVVEKDFGVIINKVYGNIKPLDERFAAQFRVLR